MYVYKNGLWKKKVPYLKTVGGTRTVLSGLIPCRVSINKRCM